MKRKTMLQTILVAALMLIVGFIAGIFFAGFPPNASLLTGTIGKVDRYRNVQITEDDILLRNELLDNSELQIQYRDYLNYYYYKAVQSTTGLSRLIEVSSGIDDFQVVYTGYKESLLSYRKFLDAGRVDILDALTTIVSLSKDQKLPVVERLNQAGNAISRMNHQDGMLAELLMAISDFLYDRPDMDYPALVDMHDLLAINIFESAYITQNKPLLKYLDKKPLMNDADGVEKLIGDSNMAVSMNKHLALDAQQMQNRASNADLLGSVVLGMADQLSSSCPRNMTKCLNSSADGGVLVFSVDHLSVAYQNNVALDGVMKSVNQLGSFLNSADLLGRGPTIIN